ncbi:hypothetical protein M422DRAFT_193138 [Sphaerobolus stellatus SS14]|uniref:Reverse transcriptase zinc-binding domain-containing protein n=1 Tax=Sphaerobolus stellatus (strain SS14) TaxID=990650 RepID=A0A0C9T9I9_SPHS4|nr:hypothetical protein M422DRAFT_193138 [Sphaerobolus stellatus SS14]
MLNLTIPPSAKIIGANLKHATQASLTKALSLRKQTNQRLSTNMMLERVRISVAEWTNREPTDKRIWLSIRKKDISRGARNFLWRSLHDLYRLGKKWLHLEGYEERASCHVCDEFDSLDHVLTECRVPGQALIWKLAKSLWQETGRPWPEISLGIIRGCGLSNYLLDNKRPDAGLNRLFLIIVSKSAYLIWKIRCEWKIKHEGRLNKCPSIPEVTAKWRSAMSKRIQFEIIASDSGRFKRTAIPVQLVKQTWGRLLKTEHLRGLKMRDITGFLVGIGLDDPP